MWEKLGVTVCRDIQRLPGVYVMTNNCAKFRVNFPVVFTNLRPRQQFSCQTRTHKDEPTSFRRVHVNDTLYGFSTLVEVLSRTCHLKIIHIDDEQKVKFSMIKDRLPGFRKHRHPAHCLKLVFTVFRESDPSFNTFEKC